MIWALQIGWSESAKYMLAGRTHTHTYIYIYIYIYIHTYIYIYIYIYLPHLATSCHGASPEKMTLPALMVTASKSGLAQLLLLHKPRDLCVKAHMVHEHLKC